MVGRADSVPSFLILIHISFFNGLYHFLNDFNLILKSKVIVLICSVGRSGVLLLSGGMLFCSLFCFIYNNIA